MAIRTVRESDLSGQSQASTVTFGFEDTWYEIDLTKDERKQLEKALADYLNKGRKTTNQIRTRKKRTVPGTTAEERDQIRAWAREQGLELSVKGQIPVKVVDAYDKAHGIARDK